MKIEVYDNNGVLLDSICFKTKRDVGSNSHILVNKKPISILIGGNPTRQVNSGKEILEYVLAYAYGKDPKQFRTIAVSTEDYYVFRVRPSREEVELKDLSGGGLAIYYDKKIGNKEIISDIAQAMLDFDISSIVITVRCTCTSSTTSSTPSASTTPPLPFIKYISGNLRYVDLKQEIDYARSVINASRYPLPIEFHIDTIPVFLINKQDMDLFSPPEKIVNLVRMIAEGIVVRVLECIFRRAENNNNDLNNEGHNNPINENLNYFVCEANVSNLTQGERNDLANIVNQLIETIIKLINEKVIKDSKESLEDINVSDQLINELLQALLPLFAKLLGSWMHHDNEDCTTRLKSILRHVFKARRSFVTLGLYCHSNPDPGKFFKEMPNDYDGPTIFLCPDRICRDRRGINERKIAFAKTMVHEFCHAYMDVSNYGTYDELHHCIEESYANALTLRVFETFAYETNNYLSGIGKKSTLKVVKDLMVEQSKDYALGVPLFEKRTYFPERWRVRKANVGGANPLLKDDYLNVVYLRDRQNLCISNILSAINPLL